MAMFEDTPAISSPSTLTFRVHDTEILLYKTSIRLLRHTPVQIASINSFE